MSDAGISILAALRSKHVERVGLLHDDDAASILALIESADRMRRVVKCDTIYTNPNDVARCLCPFCVAGREYDAARAEME